MKSYRVAIAGATGAGGAELLSVLERRNFPVASIRALASGKSAGRGEQAWWILEDAAGDWSWTLLGYTSRWIAGRRCGYLPSAGAEGATGKAADRRLVFHRCRCWVFPALCDQGRPRCLVLVLGLVCTFVGVHALEVERLQERIRRIEDEVRGRGR